MSGPPIPQFEEPSGAADSIVQGIHSILRMPKAVSAIYKEYKPNLIQDL
jgi:hypothetical protein